MKHKRVSILFALLFLIGATFASLHELEHIGSDTHSECLVCVIKQNVDSADVLDIAIGIEILEHSESFCEKNSFYSHLKPLLHFNKDPPLL